MISLADNSWLAKHVDDPQTRVIDPRPRVKYLQGHIPKAVNFALSEIFDKETLELYSLERLVEVVGKMGVDMDSTVVLYDSYDGQSAAMLAWLLEYLGHPRVSILSNYLEGWAKNGGKILYRQVDNEPRSFNLKTGFPSRANINQVRANEGEKLLDLRGGDEFQGKVSTEPRPGHIPGAINLPWTELISNDGSFLKSRPELKSVFARTGLNETDRIITYCSNGPRAALGYIALQQSGFENIRVYDGSFHQWARRPDFPIQQGNVSIDSSSKTAGVASPCTIEGLPELSNQR